MIKINMEQNEGTNHTWMRLITFLFGKGSLGKLMLKQNIVIQILLILLCIGLIYFYIQYRIKSPNY